MVDGITSAETNGVEYATKKKSDLDKDAFLKLMIAQLQNQDPLEPLDGTDYSAQLAQFSSLEQMQNINETLNRSLDANYLLSQSVNNTMTANLIGKEVKIAGDTVNYEGQASTTIGYDLMADAQEVTIQIKDKNGAPIKTFENVNTDMGQHKLSWDFTDDEGNKVSGGDYTIEITGKSLGLNDMEIAQYFVGKIDGVRYSSNGTSIVVNDLEYQVSEIFEVVEADGESNNSSDDNSGSRGGNKFRPGEGNSSG